MSILKIYLFGDVDLQGASSTRIHFLTKKSKSLFAFLVIHKDRRFTRATLAGQFWPEIEDTRAQRSLNTEIWRLRTVLKNSGLKPEKLLSSDRDRVGFRGESDHWLDVAEFHALTQSLTLPKVMPTDPQSLLSLNRAIALYRGDFAEGIFDEWCLVQRESYRLRLVAALELLLAAAIAREAWEEAISYGRRLLDLDPLQEHIHRALMRCHFALGNRPAALNQYAACERLLREELQIEPMEETRMLLGYLTTTTTAEEATQRSTVCHVEIGLPGQRINAALASLARARRLLEDASRQLRVAASDRRVTQEPCPTCRSGASRVLTHPANAALCGAERVATSAGHR